MHRDMKLEKYSLVVPGQKTGEARLLVYRIDTNKNAPDRKRPMIVVCGGGGYEYVSDREQEPVALQFLAMGYHACLLEYSVEPNVFPTALLELASAVAMVRRHAQEWGVDGDKIITCGFSAGGHLAASLGVFWNREMVYGALEAKPEDIKPNGQILCYPVITSGEKAHRGSVEKLLGAECEKKEKLELVSLEKQVTPEAPITFLWHTLTDQAVPVENSLSFAEAMHRNGVNFEMHIYPVGGHGLSLATQETGGNDENMIQPYCESWVDMVKVWMKHNFFVEQI